MSFADRLFTEICRECNWDKYLVEDVINQLQEIYECTEFVEDEK